MRRPYRERLSLIVSELGAGVAGNGQNLNDTIRRAVPALRETDQVLAILARQNTAIRDLNVNADTVVSDLAGNRRDVARWVDKANRTAQISAARRQDIAAGLQRLPGFLRRAAADDEVAWAASPTTRADAGQARRAVPEPHRDLRPPGPVRQRLAPGLPHAGRRLARPATRPSRRRARRSRSSPRSPRARPSWATTSRSSSSTSTTGQFADREGPALARAARATPASRRCCSTSTTRRCRRPPTRPRTTS